MKAVLCRMLVYSIFVSWIFGNAEIEFLCKTVMTENEAVLSGCCLWGSGFRRGGDVGSFAWCGGPPFLIIFHGGPSISNGSKRCGGCPCRCPIVSLPVVRPLLSSDPPKKKRRRPNPWFGLLSPGLVGSFQIEEVTGPEINEFFDLSPPDSQDLHVLAVDDSVVDRMVIERLLKISSCKVTVVDSGWSALQFLGLDGENSSTGFNDLKVNMIITDYCMPGMNGYELLKKIKESSSFREIPVVIMSSENVLARIDRCLEEGAEEFIMKPVKLSDVKRLKDYLIRVAESRWIHHYNKRKLRDPTTDFSSSSPPSSSSSSLSTSSPRSPSPSPPESPSSRLRTNSDCES
ncbi:hypothetical protein NE237_020917 [Protea cynaroides]|uniref:Response regulatory domain-containing protein n=1 Tax=Protea cynaroides TaxID=273540 RepID=A0A9Q0K312_9MAGN|nr:hypothetical protein NE237_020917 [Protea cynaroides]